MIAEFELTGWILDFAAVRKPRGTCEKTVKKKISEVLKTSDVGWLLRLFVDYVPQS
jgi:hypothetical protein